MRLPCRLLSVSTCLCSMGLLLSMVMLSLLPVGSTGVLGSCSVLYSCPCPYAISTIGMSFAPGINLSTRARRRRLQGMIIVTRKNRLSMAIRISIGFSCLWLYPLWVLLLTLQYSSSTLSIFSVNHHNWPMYSRQLQTHSNRYRWWVSWVSFLWWCSALSLSVTTQRTFMVKKN